MCQQDIQHHINKAESLLKAYPDIIDRIIKNNLDDIDFDKIHGFGEKTFKSIKDKVLENFSLIDLVDRFEGLFSKYDYQ